VTEAAKDAGSDAEIVDLSSGLPHPRRPGDELDPHWWHDPRNVPHAVLRLAEGLVREAPEREAEVARRTGNYATLVRAVDLEVARCIRAIPPARRKLVTDHDAFGYFAKRYGITVVGAVIPSQTTQAQPSAKDVSELVDRIEREGVKAVFPETSVSPKLAETIADQTGASSDQTLYGDTLGPEGSSGATYLQMEAANADAMVQGFSGGQRGCQIPGIR
jgi:zinc/manganese transport system substrate-binding protein